MPFQLVTTDDINVKLRPIESEHLVRVLFACESGSRSLGFASPESESDYDVRFIFVRRTEDYLTVLPPRNTIECPVTDVWDLAGWDLKKALTLIEMSAQTCDFSRGSSRPGFEDASCCKICNTWTESTP